MGTQTSSLTIWESFFWRQKAVAVEGQVESPCDTRGHPNPEGADDTRPERGPPRDEDERYHEDPTGGMIQGINEIIQKSTKENPKGHSLVRLRFVSGEVLRNENRKKSVVTCLLRRKYYRSRRSVRVDLALTGLGNRPLRTEIRETVCRDRGTGGPCLRPPHSSSVRTDSLLGGSTGFRRVGFHLDLDRGWGHGDGPGVTARNPRPSVNRNGP